MARITKLQKKVIDLLGRHGPAKVAEVAALLWPSMIGHQWALRVTAEAILERLKKDDLAMSTEYGYMLSGRGLRLRDELFPLVD